MISTKRPQYETEDQEFAFGDGFTAGVKAMCKKYNIKESDVYAKPSKETGEKK